MAGVSGMPGWWWWALEAIVQELGGDLVGGIGDSVVTAGPWVLELQPWLPYPAVSEGISWATQLPGPGVINFPLGLSLFGRMWI